MIDPARFRSALLQHFDRHRRPLPWRADRNPYRVMVSEFMLQQTRAETVAGYYERWIKRFPGWRSLADASDDEVLLEWKGLGYYARARNLRRTAQVVCEDHGGRLPDDPAALRTLPGVGEYTTAAVASIAFGAPVAAVDGNVRRVLARLLNVANPKPAHVRRAAARLLDPDRPGDHNEAMMELGATVCTPRNPLCDSCPVAKWCGAYRAGTVERRPSPPRRRTPPRVDYATIVAFDPAGKVLLTKRPPKGLLAGMWEFPSTKMRDGDADPTPPARRRLLDLGLHGRPLRVLPPVRHVFTHLRAVYHPVVLRCRDGSAVPNAVGTARKPAARQRWTRPADLDALALPVAQQKIGRLAAAHLAEATLPPADTRPRASG